MISNGHYVGLINNQYSKDHGKIGPGYVKYSDEPCAVRSYLSKETINFLCCVNLDDLQQSDQLHQSLPKILDVFEKALPKAKEQLDMYDGKLKCCMMESEGFRIAISRDTLVAKEDVLTILIDRFKKITTALADGSSLKAACKAYKIFLNKQPTYSWYQYEDEKLFIESQHKLNIKMPCPDLGQN